MKLFGRKLKSPTPYPEMTEMQKLADFRKSGVCDRIEIFGDRANCSPCRAGFEGVHKINAPNQVPHPQCDNPWGCAATVTGIAKGEKA